MKQKIYKKDHKENIKMFQDVENPKEFSAYSIDLNRYFGERSYPEFYKRLIEHKKYATDNFIKLFEKENKGNIFKMYDKSFDIKKFKKSLKNMKLKEIIYNNKLKNPYLERLRNSKNNISIKNNKKKNKIIKPYFPEVPEVGRYTPSYNAVTKHIYEVCFSKTGLNETFGEKTNIHNKGKVLIKNLSQRIPEKSNSPNKDNYLLDTNNKEKFYTPAPTTPSKRFFSLNNTQPRNKDKSKLIVRNKIFEQKKNLLLKTTSNILNDLKNNHCLKFEKYTPREPLLKEISYNNENNVELPNYFSQKYIRGNTDFNKLSSNKKIKSYFEEVSNKFNNPPLGFYQPKYNSVLNKTRDIYFSKKAPPSSRHRKIKKIIFSYDVPYDYQIAPSLNNSPKNNIE